MSGSDSDLELIPFEQTKKAELERRKQTAERKAQTLTKKLQQKEQIKEKIKKEKEIQLVSKQKNLFDEEPQEQSSSTQSHLLNSNKLDESLQRNLQEKLSDKVIKSIKIPQARQTQTIVLQNKSKKIIKKFNDKLTIETLGREINHQKNQMASLNFLKQHIINKHKRVPLSKIIGQKQ